VLMKIGGEMKTVLAALERSQLLDRAVYVSKATLPEQRIERDLRRVADLHGDCFGMVVVSRQDRSGVLVSFRERPP
jgi:precorrin-2/cobalt-factor-2 C20-methyltransferase